MRVHISSKQPRLPWLPHIPLTTLVLKLKYLCHPTIFTSVGTTRGQGIIRVVVVDMGLVCLCTSYMRTQDILSCLK